MTGYIKGTGVAGPIQQSELVVYALYRLIAIFPISVALVSPSLIYFIRIPGEK